MQQVTFLHSKNGTSVICDDAQASIFAKRQKCLLALPLFPKICNKVLQLWYNLFIL